MTLTFSLVDPWDDGKRVHVSDTIVASGDTLDLSEVPLIASDQPSVQGTAWMAGLAGYDYVFIRRRNEPEQSENLSAGRGRRALPGARRRILSGRNHRRHHHVLWHLQKTSVATDPQSLNQTMKIEAAQSL